MINILLDLSICLLLSSSPTGLSLLENSGKYRFWFQEWSLRNHENFKDDFSDCFWVFWSLLSNLIRFKDGNDSFQ